MRSNVYRDVKSIQPGTDWLEAVRRSVLSSDILVAVIGANWVAEQVSGERRIDDRRDAVRLEVATALASKMPILPVLANGAVMPRPEDVPLDVSKVTRINALPISVEGFESDVDSILTEIGELTSRGPRRSFLQRITSKTSKPGPLVGTWVSTGRGDALLQYTFHGDGTYEFAGG